jgi:membrane associated rhomboid family serine protease
MFFPLKDDNPRSRIGFQYVTVALIALCVIVYFYQATLADLAALKFIYGFGFVPVTLFGELSLAPELYRVPPWATLFTSMFLHGDLLHLIGNMAFLWIFGDNIEDALGHVRFFLFYFACGVAATFAHGLFEPLSEVPTIGASGAISGVLGAYIMLFPRRGVWIFFFYIVRRVPAWGALGLWIGLQVLYATVLNDPQSSTAWWAHIGGFIAGVILIVFIRPRGVRLFDRGHGLTAHGPWGRRHRR